jgi:hypothetical protein
MYLTFYKDERDALKNWRSKKENRLLDIIKEIERKYENEKISFYSFQKIFLKYLLHTDQDGKLKLDANLAFHQLTLKNDSIFVKETLRQKKSSFKFNQVELDPLLSSPLNSQTSVVIVEDPTFNLPNQKGLRFTIFSIIFSHFSPRELMMMGLVSKEWLSISRHDFLWKTIFFNEYKKDLEQKYPFVKMRMSRSKNESIFIFKRL